MGGMGPLAGDQRYVVTIEIPGQKNAQDAEKVRKIIDELKRTFGATVKLSITGSK